MPRVRGLPSGPSPYFISKSYSKYRGFDLIVFRLYDEYRLGDVGVSFESLLSSAAQEESGVATTTADVRKVARLDDKKLYRV